MKWSDTQNGKTRFSDFIFFFSSLTVPSLENRSMYFLDCQLSNLKCALNLGLCFHPLEKKGPKAINMLLALLYLTTKASPENTSIFSMIQ